MEERNRLAQQLKTLTTESNKLKTKYEALLIWVSMTQEEIGLDLATSVILAYKHHAKLNAANRDRMWGKA